ncbi:MAG: LptA/OstA family protein [Cyanobacteriota bacterium]
MSKIIQKILFIILIISFFIVSEASQAITVTIEADKQDFKVDNNTAHFQGNVKVNFDNIMISSPQATLTSDSKGEPDKAIFTDGASAVMKKNGSDGDIKAEKITLLLASNQLIAQGNTYSRIEKGSPGSITVKANQQEFNNQTKEVKASGNVLINYKNMVISGGEAVLLNNEAGKPYKATISGHAKVVRDSTTITAGTISIELSTNNVTASGGVSTVTTLKDTGKVSMSSSSQVYNKANNTIIGTGNVKVIYEDYTATGPKASIYLAPDNSLNTIVFTGRSQIKDALRKVSANIIKVTTNPKNFVAEGNVKTEFIKSEISKPVTTPKPENTPVEKPTEPSSEPTPQPTLEPIVPPSNVINNSVTPEAGTNNSNKE